MNKKICQQTHFHPVHGLDQKHFDAHIENVAIACAKKNLRFTSLRKQVLALILQAQKPLGAYDIIALLQAETAKNSEKQRNIAPPTVYRSLDFLLEHGFIHRLASINAFIPCCHPRDPHEAAFLICQDCNQVLEYAKNPLFSELNQLIKEDSFTSKQMIVEVLGLCERCKNKPHEET